MPELSVLVPARNAEATVGRAMRSTLRAMPKDSELVVLNDGSTDGTATELAAIGDRRLRVITGNGDGVGAALTRLLAETDSRIVARMDADDISLPWRFSDARRALRSADFVFAPTIELRRGPRPGVPLRISPEVFGLHVLLTNPVCHPTMVATRSAIDQVGGYRTVPSEDYDLWLRSVAAGKRLMRVRRWGLIYRVHPGQVTASNQWRARSWADERQADAFAEASRRVLGRSVRRLVQVRDLPAGQKEAALADFTSAFEPALATVTGVEGAFLRRRWAARRAWAAETVAVETAEGSDDE